MSILYTKKMRWLNSTHAWEFNNPNRLLEDDTIHLIQQYGFFSLRNYGFVDSLSHWPVGQALIHRSHRHEESLSLIRNNWYLPHRGSWRRRDTLQKSWSSYWLHLIENVLWYCCGSGYFLWMLSTWLVSFSALSCQEIKMCFHRLLQ